MFGLNGVVIATVPPLKVGREHPRSGYGEEPLTIAFGPNAALSGLLVRAWGEVLQPRPPPASGDKFPRETLFLAIKAFNPPPSSDNPLAKPTEVVIT